MAICTWCQQEMHDRIGCNLTVFGDFEDLQPRRRIPFGKEMGSVGQQEHCPDCLSPIDAFHHPGCDIEQCPRCDKQAVTCGCAVQFRPSAKALAATLDIYRRDNQVVSETEILVYTDIYALDIYPVTSIFHWPQGVDPLGWWFFAEEREVTSEILRVTPVGILIEKDPELVKLLELPAGKKAFRDEDSSDWDILDID